MTDEQLEQLGFTTPETLGAARTCARHAEHLGLSHAQIRKGLRQTLRSPGARLRHEVFAPLAEALTRRRRQGKKDPDTGRTTAPWRQWGNNLDPEAIAQMTRACSLPVAVRGALMPDAHVGYGLPIGGVLATDNAVIPYAVGVDIACRMKLSVLDLPPDMLDDARADRLRRAIEKETRFGVGAQFSAPRTHPVMDRDWTVSPVTASQKDKAWRQLGTSGSGNHFVEFGEFEVLTDDLELSAGRYLALLSHSGSRGVGAAVCDHYSDMARSLRPHLSPEMRHLAWLDMDSQAGREYWAAMELMGAYAAANHELIHAAMAACLGAQTLLSIENHHNFAWREVHDGRKVVVHRKGATPASRNALGIIPGSMASPAYVVRGKGNPDSLESVSHGAGRILSRAQAKKTLSRDALRHLLAQRRVTLLSAGLDEAPMAYKNIDEVMACQRDLAEILARFTPRLVKMAPAGERAED